MTFARLAKADRYLVDKTGQWFHYVMDTWGGETMIVRLFENRKSADYFVRRLSQPPSARGRVRFK
jgi:hypothetical protein